ncbi:MAG: undecaprenyl-phosphate glucose phosphotransferase [Kiritimatiellae bacterium]|nr:undecaprenyl-phosphate glucose phosphotransferase [Kiritimatiellia bacterium]
MREKDTPDVMYSIIAVLTDTAAIMAGALLAVWMRFDSGWFVLRHAPPDPLYPQYAAGALVMTGLFLLVMHNQGLYSRPQTGTFITKIPRITKSAGMGCVLTIVIAFLVQNDLDYSRLAILLSLPCTLFLLMLERWILFRIEWNWSRHSSKTNSVLILGTDTVAAHVRRTLKKEPMLRSRVIGFMRVSDNNEIDERIEPELVIGHIDTLAEFIKEKHVNQIILTDASLDHRAVMNLVLLCEHNLITFNMVPDLFRIMTSSMDVQSLDDIPLLGVRRWPLDFFWNRLTKRAEDILGSFVGLLLSAPVVLAAAIMIKRDSPGPVFYAQERCGEHGRIFKLYKLRTMRIDAEHQTGPVFTTADDSRRTRTGAVLRRYNIDELPQFWNVFKGDMSLVGPRPERPHFVEQFKTDVSGYMWRHKSLPGLTGWAQVKGLRGDTSISERIKYDLYYLENWSLSFDFKILAKTLFAHDNAY